MNIVRLLKLRYINDELNDVLLYKKFPILYKLFFKSKYYHDTYTESILDGKNVMSVIVYYLDSYDNWIYVHNITEIYLRPKLLTLNFDLLIPLYQEHYADYTRNDYIDVITDDVYNFLSYLIKNNK